HSSLVHMFHVLRREFGSAQSEFLGSLGEDGAWMLDFEAAESALREASAEDSPVLLMGTAFSFVHLLDHLESRRLRFELSPGSRVLETGGYKGRSRAMPKTELHRLIEERLGVSKNKIVCEYGMSELSSQAYDSPWTGSRRFRFPRWA